jgi:hypothetical protein
VNQFFAVPSLDNDEAAEIVSQAIRRQDPDAIVRIDARARMVTVLSLTKAELIAGSIAASGHPVSSWVEEMRWVDSIR